MLRVGVDEGWRPGPKCYDFISWQYEMKTPSTKSGLLIFRSIFNVELKKAPVVLSNSCGTMPGWFLSLFSYSCLCLSHGFINVPQIISKQCEAEMKAPSPSSEFAYFLSSFMQEAGKSGC